MHTPTDSSSDAKRQDPKRELLRHTVATVAYRGAKAVRNAPAGFADFRAGDGLRDVPRTPGQILAHIGDLYDWALSIAAGQQKWQNSEPLPWDREVERFFAALKKFDEYLASDEPMHAAAEELFQGPVADSLTHIGQISILRRMAGSPVKGENYYQANIESGNVGADQPPPKREF
jgi:hypothetical protein